MTRRRNSQVGPQHCVGCVQEINRMDGSGARTASEEPCADLHEASGVSSRHKLSSSLGNVGELRREHCVRCLRLDEIENARATAALVGIPQWKNFELGDCGEHSERRQRNALAVKQMTRRIVANSQWKSGTWLRPGGSKQLAHIADSAGNCNGAIAPC